MVSWMVNRLAITSIEVVLGIRCDRFKNAYQVAPPDPVLVSGRGGRRREPLNFEPVNDYRNTYSN